MNEWMTIQTCDDDHQLVLYALLHNRMNEINNGAHLKSSSKVVNFIKH